MSNIVDINKNAFSSSQVLSKIWLSEMLESVVEYYNIGDPLRILCLGGWYGVTNFIIRTRNKLNVELFRSVDIDKDACTVADLINKAWEYQEWQFKSLNEDANTVHYTPTDYNTVINTSAEHMDSTQWFDNIPPGTLTIIQSNNMPHEEHCYNHEQLEDLIRDFPLARLLYSGEKLFTYPDRSFRRFMIIGEK